MYKSHKTTMSHSGHVFDMINRLKQNRAQRSSNRAKFKGNNRDGIYDHAIAAPEKPNLKLFLETR